MTGERVIRAIERERLIVVLRNIDPAQLMPLADALIRGGVRLAEVTFGAASDETVAESIFRLNEQFAGELIVGGGTVMCPKQVAAVREAGGRFVVSPHTDPSLIRETVGAGLVSVPGAYTPTEIQTASAAGADLIKLFPAGNMGAAYVKAVSAPFSHVRLLAFGGISLQNIADYADAGVAGFGISSGIIDPALLNAGRFDEIADRAAQYVRAIRESKRGIQND